MATEEITHPSFRCKLFVTRCVDEYGSSIRVNYASEDGVEHGYALTIGTKNDDGVPRTDEMCVEEIVQVLLNNAT
jgi:hypothetical protein